MFLEAFSYFELLSEFAKFENSTPTKALETRQTLI